MRCIFFCCLGVSVCLIASFARAGDLTIQLGGDAKITVANAIERGSAVTVAGQIDGTRATFPQLQSGTAYDVAIELADGRLLCGADMSWCDPTPPDPQAEPLDDDDRSAISAIVTDILGFADKPKLARLIGTHERAVGLVDLTRLKGFHSDKGDEVIWREEVWFFKWENGGWERVPDQSRLLRRERFASKAAYEKEIARVRWVTQLGGVQINGDNPTTIELPADAMK